jgi:hypothetical protein
MADMQWKNIEPTAAEVKAYGEIKAQEKALATAIFKRAGGKGEPTRHSFKQLATKGVGFPADDFAAGNVKTAPAPVVPKLSAEDAETVMDWIKAIKDKGATLAQAAETLADYPLVIQAVRAGLVGSAPKPGAKAKRAPKPGKVA